MNLIKVILSFLLILTIFACDTNIENENLDPVTPVDLGGKEIFGNIKYVNVELFDSVDIKTLDKDNFQVDVKKNIFDIEKIYSSKLPIYNDYIRQSSSGFSNGGNYKGVHFNSILTMKYVMNGFPTAYEYFNEEFINDISLLENNEVDAHYIYDKYGTEFTTSCYTYYDTKIEVRVEALDSIYNEYKQDFIEYLFNSKPTLAEKTKYEAMYKCFNINYSYNGFLPINSRDDFKIRLNNLMYGEFSFIGTTTRLYDALPDRFPNAIEKLRDLYINTI